MFSYDSFVPFAEVNLGIMSVCFLLEIYEAELAFSDWRKMSILWIYLHNMGSLETGLGLNKSPIPLKIRGFSEVSKRPGDRA